MHWSCWTWLVIPEQCIETYRQHWFNSETLAVQPHLHHFVMYLIPFDTRRAVTDMNQAETWENLPVRFFSGTPALTSPSSVFHLSVEEGHCHPHCSFRVLRSASSEQINPPLTIKASLWRNDQSCPFFHGSDLYPSLIQIRRQLVPWNPTTPSVKQTNTSQCGLKCDLS